MNFNDVKLMKQQLQELHMQIKTAEFAASSQSLMRHSASSNSVASGGGDLLEALHAVRNEQIRLQQTVHHLLSEKLVPMEIRLDMFDEIGERIVALKEKTSLSGGNGGNNLALAAKLEELEMKLSGVSMNCGMKAPKDSNSNNLSVDLDLLRDLLTCIAAGITEMKDNLSTSHKQVLDEVKIIKETVAKQKRDKKPDDNEIPLKTVNYAVLESLPVEKLNTVLKQLRLEIQKREDHAKILAPIIYGQSPPWFADKIKLVNGLVIADSGVKMSVEDFRTAIFNTPQKVFPGMEFGVECSDSDCKEMVPLKRFCKDGVSVKCGSCLTQTVFGALKDGHRWVKFSSCGHHALAPIGENPEKCTLCGYETSSSDVDTVKDCRPIDKDSEDFRL